MPIGLARLKRRADFLRVAARRQRAVRPGLILQAAPCPPEDRLAEPHRETIRVGFTASRRVGGAVQRNRAKRRLRAAAAELLPHSAQPGTDYVLIARTETGGRPYAELIGDLAGALRQLGRTGSRPAGDNRPRHREEE